MNLPTKIVAVAADNPEADVLARAAALLQRGRLVAFPTETVYGLGANALDAEAVMRIFTAKGRPATNPIIVHVGSVEEARRLTADWPAVAEALAASCWPGPLTLVLRRSANVPDVVTAGGETVAVRMPAHPVALHLLQACGLPIAAPSANRSSRLSATRAEHVQADLVGRIDMILDGGPTPGGIESTVLDVSTSPPRLLRPGLFTLADIEKLIGPIARQKQAANVDRPLPSPGMLSRHYAPSTPLVVVEGDGRPHVEALLAEGKRIGWLRFYAGAALSANGLETITMPTTPEAYAAQLFAVLHELDRKGLATIVVEMPPDEDVWLAVRDRLKRAAAPA